MTGNRWLVCGVVAACAVSAIHVGFAASSHTGQVTVGAVPVPGATVTATRDDTTIVTTTDGQGYYQFADLADGPWTLRVEMTGFEPVEREIQSAPDLHPSTWRLELRPFSEIGAALEVRPGPGERHDMPAALTAGATPLTLATRSSQGNSPSPTSVDATSATDAAIESSPEAADGLLVNGSVNNAAASPFAQLAAFGNNRRGRGWRYTGGAGAILGNSAWDARPYSFSATPTAKPSYRDLHLAGNIGGPLRIPRLLATGPDVFIGFQHSIDHRTTTVPAVVPTLAERLGDFSHSVDGVGRRLEPIDPRTGAPFAARMIPQNRIDPAASALLAYYPLPNLDETGGVNYQTALDTILRQSVIQARITQPSSRRTRITGNFTYQKTTTESANVFGFADDLRLSGIDAGLDWSRRFSPRFSVRAAYQLTRLTRDTVPYFANLANVSAEAGIAGNAQDPLNWGPPSLAFSSVEGLTDAAYAFERTLKHAWSAESVLHRGRHAITMGGDIRRHAVDLQTPQDPRGTFSFDGSITGADFADFLLGLPHAASMANGQLAGFRATVLDAYVNDDWRPAVGVTVTAGVRWEYEPPMTERDGRLVNLDVAAGFAAVSPVAATDSIGPLTGRRYPASLVFPDRSGIQPRLGISWRPRAQSSMVIRGGYGAYRSTNVYQPIATLMTQQPPLSNTFTVETNASQPLTLSTGFLATLPAVHNTFAVDPDFRVGVVQSWQASIQHDLPASLTVLASYLGARGGRLMQETLPNSYPTGGVNPCGSCPVGFVYLTSNGRSLRHAAQLQLRRRLHHGLTATAQYTLAKAMDDAAAIGGVSTNGGAIAQDWQHPAREWARSAFDQRHLLALQVQYSTGVGLGGGGLLDGVKAKLFNGWTLTSQLTTGSGLPFTPVYLTSVAGTGIIGTLRPDLNGSLQPVSDGAYLNPAAFSAPAAGGWGTAPRNAASGPAQFSLNAGATRTFTLSDRFSLDWRVDAANVLNRVTFAGVNAIFDHPQFGLPNRANTMRTLQTTVRLRF